MWPIPGEFGAKELAPDPVSRRRSSSTCRLDGRLLLETCSPDLWRLFRLTFFDLDNRGLSGGGKDGALQETVNWRQLKNWWLKFDKRLRPLRVEFLSGLPLCHILDTDLIPFFELKKPFQRSDSRDLNDDVVHNSSIQPPFYQFDCENCNLVQIYKNKI